MASVDRKGSRQFTFIDVSGVADNPEDLKRQVRSNAAFKGWNARKPKSISSDSSPATTLSQDDDYDTPSQTTDSLTPNKKLRDATTLSAIRPKSRTRSLAESKTCKHQHDSSGALTQTRAKVITRRRRQSAETKKQNVARELAMDHLITTLPNPMTMLRGNTDPFNAYPVEPQPWFGWVLNYYFTEFWPIGAASLGLTPLEGRINATSVAKIMMTDPAPFYMALCSAAAVLLQQNRISPIINFWIRGQTIHAVNSALSDQRRALSDALIYAVGMLVAHEAFYGDQTAALTVHRPAQQRMLEMIGGVDKWNIPSLLKKSCSRLDSLVSALTLTPRALRVDDGDRYDDSEGGEALRKRWPGRGVGTETTASGEDPRRPKVAATELC